MERGLKIIRKFLISWFYGDADVSDGADSKPFIAVKDDQHVTVETKDEEAQSKAELSQNAAPWSMFDSSTNTPSGSESDEGEDIEVEAYPASDHDLNNSVDATIALFNLNDDAEPDDADNEVYATFSIPLSSSLPNVSTLEPPSGIHKELSAAPDVHIEKPAPWSMFDSFTSDLYDGEDAEECESDEENATKIEDADMPVSTDNTGDNTNVEKPSPWSMFDSFTNDDDEEQDEDGEDQTLMENPSSVQTKAVESKHAQEVDGRDLIDIKSELPVSMLDSYIAGEADAENSDDSDKLRAQSDTKSLTVPASKAVHVENGEPKTEQPEVLTADFVIGSHDSSPESDAAAVLLLPPLRKYPESDDSEIEEESMAEPINKSLVRKVSVVSESSMLSGESYYNNYESDEEEDSGVVALRSNDIRFKDVKSTNAWQQFCSDYFDFGFASDASIDKSDDEVGVLDQTSRPLYTIRVQSMNEEEEEEVDSVSEIESSDNEYSTAESRWHRQISKPCHRIEFLPPMDILNVLQEADHLGDDLSGLSDMESIESEYEDGPDLPMHRQARAPIRVKSNYHFDKSEVPEIMVTSSEMAGSLGHEKLGDGTIALLTDSATSDEYNLRYHTPEYDSRTDEPTYYEDVRSSDEDMQSITDESVEEESDIEVSVDDLDFVDLEEQTDDEELKSSVGAADQAQTYREFVSVEVVASPDLVQELEENVAAEEFDKESSVESVKSIELDVQEAKIQAEEVDDDADMVANFSITLPDAETAKETSEELEAPARANEVSYVKTVLEHTPGEYADFIQHKPKLGEHAYMVESQGPALASAKINARLTHVGQKLDKVPVLEAEPLPSVEKETLEANEHGVKEQPSLCVTPTLVKHEELKTPTIYADRFQEKRPAPDRGTFKTHRSVNEKKTIKQAQTLIQPTDVHKEETDEIPSELISLPAKEHGKSERAFETQKIYHAKPQTLTMQYDRLEALRHKRPGECWAIKSVVQPTRLREKVHVSMPPTVRTEPLTKKEIEDESDKSFRKSKLNAPAEDAKEAERKNKKSASKFKPAAAPVDDHFDEEIQQLRKQLSDGKTHFASELQDLNKGINDKKTGIKERGAAIKREDRLSDANRLRDQVASQYTKWKTAAEQEEAKRLEELSKPVEAVNRRKLVEEQMNKSKPRGRQPQKLESRFMKAEEKFEAAEAANGYPEGRATESERKENKKDGAYPVPKVAKIPKGGNKSSAAQQMGTTYGARNEPEGISDDNDYAKAVPTQQQLLKAKENDRTSNKSATGAAPEKTGTGWTRPANKLNENKFENAEPQAPVQSKSNKFVPEVKEWKGLEHAAVIHDKEKVDKIKKTKTPKQLRSKKVYISDITDIDVLLRGKEGKLRSFDQFDNFFQNSEKGVSGSWVNNRSSRTERNKKRPPNLDLRNLRTKIYVNPSVQDADKAFYSAKDLRSLLGAFSPTSRIPFTFDKPSSLACQLACRKKPSKFSRNPVDFAALYRGPGDGQESAVKSVSLSTEAATQLFSNPCMLKQTIITID